MKTVWINRWFRIGAILLIAMMLVGHVTRNAQAMEVDNGGRIEAGETVNDDIILSADVVVMDGKVEGMLIAMGNDVTINGTVNGDVFISGANATVTENAVINGNLFFGGQALKMNGKLDGSMFVGGSTCVVEAKTSIKRNLYFGGFSLTTVGGSKIEKDLFVGGYQAVLRGDVGRDVKMGGAALQLDGKVGRDVIADVGEPGKSEENTGWMRYMPFFQYGMTNPIDSGLHIGKDAQIAGKLTYTSPANQDTAVESKPVGGIVYQTPVPGDTNKPREEVKFTVSPFKWILDWMVGRLRDLVTLLALGALVLWLLPVLLKKVADQAWDKTLPSALWGLITIVVGYAGAVIAGLLILGVGILLGILTIGGLTQTLFGVGFSSLTFVVTIFTLLVSYGSKLVIAYLAGIWLYQKMAPQADLGKYGHKFLGLLVGVLIYVILSGIPFLGWLVSLAVTLVGVGAMWLYFRSTRTLKSASLEIGSTGL
jgi:hypothetical protein